MNSSQRNVEWNTENVPDMYPKLGAKESKGIFQLVECML